MIFSRPAKAEKDPSDWHIWFAWLPVAFEQHGMRHIVWLSKVQRSRRFAGVYDYRLKPAAREYL